MGLVANALAAAERLKGAAGGAQGVSARDRATAAVATMGKRSRPRADVGPSVLGQDRGWAGRTGGGWASRPRGRNWGRNLGLVLGGGSRVLGGAGGRHGNARLSCVPSCSRPRLGA